MDSKVSEHDILEHILHDENAEPKDLTLSLLKAITNNFSDDLRIGRGGFADIYKGRLRNGTVAVKKLYEIHAIHEEKYNEEVGCLMTVKHKNVVRFLGYCADTQGKAWEYEGKIVMADVRQRLLCFEYLPKGSLDNYITDASCGLEWRKRYQIIKGISEGLHHLHEKHIVHLDLKPANILLDGNMVPKIADFGLSKRFGEKQSRAITARLFGTMGYLAPEFCNGEITFKLDIYSLGIIITEILTGRMGYSSIENVLESWRNRLDEDTALADVLLEQVRVCTEISIECIDPNPEKRPVTRRIIEMLDEAESIGELYFKAGLNTPSVTHDKVRTAQSWFDSSGKRAMVQAVAMEPRPHWHGSHGQGEGSSVAYSSAGEETRQPQVRARWHGHGTHGDTGGHPLQVVATAAGTTAMVGDDQGSISRLAPLQQAAQPWQAMRMPGPGLPAQARGLVMATSLGSGSRTQHHDHGGRRQLQVTQGPQEFSTEIDSEYPRSNIPAQTLEPVVPVQVVGTAFTQQYYTLLRKTPDQVYRFYTRNDSTASGGMDLETVNEKVMAMNVAVAEVESVDAQQSHGGGIAVHVTGRLTSHHDGLCRVFSQSFFLAPQKNGYFVLNDMFRYVRNDPPCPILGHDEALIRRLIDMWNKLTKHTPGYNQVTNFLKLALRGSDEDSNKRPNSSHMIRELNELESNAAESTTDHDQI